MKHIVTVSEVFIDQKKQGLSNLTGKSDDSPWAGREEVSLRATCVRPPLFFKYTLVSI